MRFFLYNMRYGAGSGAGFHFPFPGYGYLRRNPGNLKRIIHLIRSYHPDLIGLVEIDGGSFLRSPHGSQAALIAKALGHFHCYCSKYAPNSLSSALPLLRKQGNAILARHAIHSESFHYFDRGVKRLVIEVELEKLVVFLVHLSLKYRDRQRQLGDLSDLVKKVRKPCLVAGDFNVLWGHRELQLFLAASGFRNACENEQFSYPSWRPRQQLDFILHSPGITVSRVEIPKVRFSDHFPLVCDFTLD
jgi:endonuclease/exonuclease/phosphatase family metal-dependent hydrolase